MHIEFHTVNNSIVAQIISQDNQIVLEQDVSRDVLKHCPVVLHRIIKNLMERPDARKHRNYYAHNVVRIKSPDIPAELRIEIAE